MLMRRILDSWARTPDTYRPVRAPPEGVLGVGVFVAFFEAERHPERVLLLLVAGAGVQLEERVPHGLTLRHLHVTGPRPHQECGRVGLERDRSRNHAVLPPARGHRVLPCGGELTNRRDPLAFELGQARVMGENVVVVGELVPMGAVAAGQPLRVDQHAGTFRELWW